ncbi:MAG: hypothetical protein KKC21_04270, partial [Nitrospinae bacterium]|nr:hypothetical protein [Nitrospinota bacterium]
TEEAVDFETSLTDEKGEEFKNMIKLFPLPDNKIKTIHNRFKFKSLFTDYKKTPFDGNDISRVYVFSK